MDWVRLNDRRWIGDKLAGEVVYLPVENIYRVERGAYQLRIYVRGSDRIETVEGPERIKRVLADLGIDEPNPKLTDDHESKT